MQMATRRSDRIATLGVMALLMILSTAGEAKAYIDPGTGSLVIQVLIGTFLAISWRFRRAWCSLMGRFFSRFSSPKDKDEGQ